MVQELSLAELVKAVIALFVVIDPVGTVPVFIGLTEGMSPPERKHVLKTTVVTSLILLIVIAIAGQQILNLFGISLNSLMIAGGILLLILSIKILVQGGWSKEEISADSVGVVPLAFPIIVGPGAITVTIVTLQTAGLLVAMISVLIVLSVTSLLLFVVNPVYRFLGRMGALVISRIMAVFIAAIAVQFIADGMRIYLLAVGLL